MTLRYGGVFEQDNIRYLLSSSNFLDPVVEGNYNTWTKKWIEKPTSGINNTEDIDALIDEKNNVITISWIDNASENRLGIYNITDFGVVFESPVGGDYTYAFSLAANKIGIHYDFVDFISGGISRSLQSYLLLLRKDYDTIEIWHGGSSVLWSRSTATDFGRAVWPDTGGISLTGKYVIIVVQDKTSPNDVYLMLYEGSYKAP